VRTDCAILSNQELVRRGRETDRSVGDVEEKAEEYMSNGPTPVP
jgi:hypothetical protein